MNKKNLLKEELKKFMAIVEYGFYVPENYKDVDDALIDEADPVDDTESDPMPDPAEAPEDDTEMEPEGDMEMEPEGDEEATDFSGPEGNSDTSIEPETEPATGFGDASGEAAIGGEEEVELDVTELVQKTDDAKNSAEETNQQMDILVQQFQELTQKLSIMGTISDKIEGLEQEMEKRMPTDQEKLEMRSLDSYPYNQKLTDYWEDKTGPYDVMGNEDKKPTPEEYVLTKDKVDAGFNDRTVKDSFNDVDPDYEEEDVY